MEFDEQIPEVISLSNTLKIFNKPSTFIVKLVRTGIWFTETIKFDGLIYRNHQIWRAVGIWNSNPGWTSKLEWNIPHYICMEYSTCKKFAKFAWNIPHVKSSLNLPDKHCSQVIFPKFEWNVTPSIDERTSEWGSKDIWRGHSSLLTQWNHQLFKKSYHFRMGGTHYDVSSYSTSVSTKWMRAVISIDLDGLICDRLLMKRFLFLLFNNQNENFSTRTKVSVIFILRKQTCQP